MVGVVTILIHGKTSLTDELVAIASRLGEDLVRDAIWHGGRCNWIGPAPLGEQKGNILWTHRPLGPDLYDGVSGIAMFLGELARVTGDVSARNTALGAIRQALGSIESAHGSLPRNGLYSGVIGVALAAAKLAHSLSCAKLQAEARRLAGMALTSAATSTEFDIISGSAGIVVGLLALRRMLDQDEKLLAGAARVGDHLLDQAVCRDDGAIAWDSPERTERGPLTGFSHGAAGGGHALLELWAVIDEDRFRSAADRSFRYEDSLLDKVHNNWPDLRARNSKDSKCTSFQTYWCHGAPGVALARLRAYQLTGESAYIAAAKIGLGTTALIVQACLETGTGNYSLCHGLLGNCEVLALGDELLRTRHRELIEGVLIAGADRIVKGYRLDAGTPYPTTPGLLTGVAGIGYFYLRASTPGIGSVLNPISLTGVNQD